MALDKVTTGVIADVAVTDAQIADDAVTDAKLGITRLSTSETAPVSPTVGQRWYKATTGVTYQYTANADDTKFWLDVSSGGIGTSASKSVDFVGDTDPHKATNGSGLAVGDVYYNKTKNKHFICTDATTGANVWAGKYDGWGGTTTEYLSGSTYYKVHTFLTSGTFSVDDTATVDALIVGGGGGGSSGTAGGAGGGAGGMRVLVSQALTQGTYTITVGDKGVSGFPSSGSSSSPVVNFKGTDGSDSSIVQTFGGSFSSTATGGGAGGLWGSVAAGLRNGNAGGSGGGGAETYLATGTATVGGTGDGTIGTSGLVSAGTGYYGGDGGDSNQQFAGAAGGSASGDGPDGITGSKGGRALIGLQNDIRDGNTTGTVVGTHRFGGGGDGNGDSATYDSVNVSGPYGGGIGQGASAVHVDQNAIANSGGGGAGGGTNGAGNGGTGIVVIRYAIT